jgi:hypothetical protein
VLSGDKSGERFVAGTATNLDRQKFQVQDSTEVAAGRLVSHGFAEVPILRGLPLAFAAAGR